MGSQTSTININSFDSSFISAQIDKGPVYQTIFTSVGLIVNNGNGINTSITEVTIVNLNDPEVQVFTTITTTQITEFKLGSIFANEPTTTVVVSNIVPDWGNDVIVRVRDLNLNEWTNKYFDGFTKSFVNANGISTLPNRGVSPPSDFGGINGGGGNPSNFSGLGRSVSSYDMCVIDLLKSICTKPKRSTFKRLRGALIKYRENNKSVFSLKHSMYLDDLVKKVLCHEISYHRFIRIVEKQYKYGRFRRYKYYVINISSLIK